MRNILAVVGAAALVAAVSGAAYGDIEYLSQSRSLHAWAEGATDDRADYGYEPWSEVVDVVNTRVDIYIHGHAEMDSVTQSDRVIVHGSASARDGNMTYGADSNCTYMSSFVVSSSQPYDFTVTWNGFLDGNSAGFRQFILQRTDSSSTPVFSSTGAIAQSGSLRSSGVLDAGTYDLTLKVWASAHTSSGLHSGSANFDAAFLVPAPASMATLVGLLAAGRPRRRYP